MGSISLKSEFLSDNKLEGEFTIEGDEAKIELTGQGAHASAPQVGRNAATFLAVFLDQFDFAGRDKSWLHFLADVEHEDFNGKKLGVAHHDDLMGDLIRQWNFRRIHRLYKQRNDHLSGSGRQCHVQCDEARLHL